MISPSTVRASARQIAAPQRMFFFLLGGFVLCFVAPKTWALTLSSQDNIPQARWSFESKPALPKKEPFKTLFELKKAAATAKWNQCVNLSVKAASKAKALAPWIFTQRLECLRDSKSNGAALDEAISVAHANHDWFLSGPYAAKLKLLLVDTYLVRLDQLSRTDRGAAEKTLDQAMARQDWMDSTQRARIYRIAGELAFVRQRLKVAESYFRRSLSEKENSEVRERIRSVLALLKEKPKEDAAVTKTIEELSGTAKERELAERMALALKSGDLVSAVEDGIEIISEYPGSQRAKWATDRIYEVYSGVAVKTDAQYVSLKKRILGEMQNVDGIRLQAWMEKAFRQGFYDDVTSLSNSAMPKLKGTVLSTKTLSLAGHAATFTGDDDRARSLFQELLLEHAGSEESVRALFRLGLMDFRKKDYISAAANFERLLVFPDSNKFELQAKYWLWRSLQKIDTEKAKKIAQELIEKFPLTYYGLRAQAETGDGKILLPTRQVKLTEELFLTSSEEKAWVRLKLLLEAGWIQEAQAELRHFAEPTNNKLRLLMSRYWAAALDYPTAMKFITQAWDEEPELVGQPFFRVAFPSEFKEHIETQSKKNSLDPNLLRGLVRQESSFLPEAQSAAGARGLTQLMPGTADDMLSDLGLKSKIPENGIFDPQINLQLGARYLQRMIKRFEGSVSLALAGYNVGPEKFARWMRARQLISQNTSDPTYEVWIDEMPWAETSFYVKAVLRNLIIYRALDKGRVQLGNPVWILDAG